jgi:hypothetical protein
MRENERKLTNVTALMIICPYCELFESEVDVHCRKIGDKICGR